MFGHLCFQAINIDGDDGALDLNGVEAFNVFEMIYVVEDFDVNVFIVVRIYYLRLFSQTHEHYNYLQLKKN
jgi:hypothetical protein